MKNRTIPLTLVCVVLCALAADAEIAIEVEVAAPQAADGASVIVVPKPQDAPAGDEAENTEDQNADSIEFVNGDKLHGHLVAANPGSNLLEWRHDAVAAPIEFQMDVLAKLSLGGRSGEGPQGSSVRLSNGDSLTGKLVSLDKDTLVLETPYAGTLRLERLMLMALHPAAGGSMVIYEGPRELSEWTTAPHGGNSWTYEDGVLSANQAYCIGKNLPELPDQASIEFEAGWSRYPQFTVSFFTDNITHYRGNCYYIQFSHSSIYCYRYSNRGSSRNLGSFNYNQFGSNNKRKAKFQILVDKEAKQVTLLINGQQARQWTDTAGFAGLGRGLVFQPNAHDGLRLENIRVTRWDGRIPNKPADDEEESSEDVIAFVNGDKVSGKMTSISNGQAKFATSYATLDVPLERIGAISFGTEDMERARRNKNDIRAHFVGGGSVTIKLDELAQGRVMGSSENFGEATLDLDSFRLLEFNIYR